MAHCSAYHVIKRLDSEFHDILKCTRYFRRFLHLDTGYDCDQQYDNGHDI